MTSADKNKNSETASKQKSWPKYLLIAAILASLVAYFGLGLNKYVTFENLKAQQSEFQDYYAQNQSSTLLLFFLAYILMAALSLPGATILTLAAGALFGLAVGLLLVSFASSLGASLAFLSSRFLFRDSVQSRFGERLQAINEGIEKEGAFYLFSLRLVPLFPFFVINLVMGLSKLPLWTFYWVSQLGMLAGTAVYVNAGTQIAKLEKASGILSPGLILSFVLLGSFPLAAKKLLQLRKKKQKEGQS